MNISFELDRFVLAQDPVYETVCDELRRGRKSTHWMRYIFSQITGLGHSALSQTYAISGLDGSPGLFVSSCLGTEIERLQATRDGREGKIRPRHLRQP